VTYAPVEVGDVEMLVLMPKESIQISNIYKISRVFNECGNIMKHPKNMGTPFFFKHRVQLFVGFGRIADGVAGLKVGLCGRSSSGQQRADHSCSPEGADGFQTVPAGFEFFLGSKSLSIITQTETTP
jgi:hypothetical protein